MDSELSVLPVIAAAIVSSASPASPFEEEEQSVGIIDLFFTFADITTDFVQ